DVTRKLSVFVIGSSTLVEDPTIFAVVSPEPVLHRKRFARVEGFRVRLEAHLRVVRMHALGPSISEFMFHAAARKLQPWFVKEGVELVDTGHPEENRRSIGNDPET